METSIAGFKKTGSWNDIVEHGERITAALIELDVTGSDFEEWNEWRPKVTDRLDKDINEKTAEKATLNESKGEEKNKSPDDDLKKAGQKLSDTGASESPKEAASDMQKSVSYALRAVDTVSRKALRVFESSVYQHVMTKMSPYYFDNQLLSANAKRKSQLGSKHQEFVLEVNINDDQLRKEVANVLDGFEDVDRWRIDAPTNTDSAEQAEGQDVPDEKTGLDHSVDQVSKAKEQQSDDGS